MCLIVVSRNHFPNGTEICVPVSPQKKFIVRRRCKEIESKDMAEKCEYHLKLRLAKSAKLVEATYTGHGTYTDSPNN